MWLREHTGCTFACLYIATAGALAVLFERSRAPDAMHHAKLANASAVYALGALAWPFVWSVVCGHSVRSLPWFAYVGLLWPVVLLTLDVSFVQHSAGHDPLKQAYGMQVDANTLSGLALTLGAVLVRNVSDGFATAAGPMTMATVLLALLFIVPTPVLHADSLHAATLRALQKVTLQYCLGFTITAVSIAFCVGMLKAPQQAVELHKAITESSTAARE